ncbi:hypothetical protein [Pontibacillus marinus]|uniref:hypothetical protein n=1 Tax=Pontibacillus marinus TaxID=273164 RepID=UPI0018CE4E1D|nr:hypothetical protein [Pontibacillus marinus]
MKSLRTFIPLFALNHLGKDQFVTNKVSYVRNDTRNVFKVQNNGTDVRKHRLLNIAAVPLVTFGQGGMGNGLTPAVKRASETPQG